MDKAKLTKLGGEIVSACDADYDTYKGFLRCLECGEPVFLRKWHVRGDSIVPDAFVHFKAVKEVSACELRVGQYSKEDVEKLYSQARKQRLMKLQVSMWKYIKRNFAFDIKSCMGFISEVKQSEFLQELVKFAQESLEGNVPFILDNTLPRMSELMAEGSPLIGVDPEREDQFKTFLKENRRDWVLHAKITREALDLFLTSTAMSEIRYRFCCCFCHPSVLSVMPDLMELDTETTEWKQKFITFLTLQICFVFLTIDWLKAFDN